MKKSIIFLLIASLAAGYTFGQSVITFNQDAYMDTGKKFFLSDYSSALQTRINSLTNYTVTATNTYYARLIIDTNTGLFTTLELGYNTNILVTAASFTTLEATNVNATNLTSQTIVTEDLTVNGAFTATPSCAGISRTNNTGVTYALTTSYLRFTNFTALACQSGMTSTISNITTEVAGIHVIHADVTGTGVATTPEYVFSVFTNNFECSHLKWRRDTSATTAGSGSATQMINLPAGCIIDLRAKSDGSDNFVYIYARLSAHKLN